MKTGRFLLLSMALTALGFVGFGCRGTSTTTTAGEQAAKEAVVTITPITQAPFGAASAPSAWKDLKIDDLDLTLRYPSEWGTASAPASLTKLAAKTISFSAFTDQAATVDVYYYASDYKPSSGMPPAYPLTAPSCGALSQLTDGNSAAATRISGCALVVTNGKFIFFFEDSAKNSDVGLLYTGDDDYPLLELVSNGATDLDTIKKVLSSVQ